MANVVTTSANLVTKPTGANTPADALGVTKRMSASETESKESYECPQCSYTSDSWHGIKAHFGRIHDGTLKPEIECDYCGDTFHVKPKRESTARFCSTDCRGNHSRAGERPNPGKLELLHWEQGLSLNQMSKIFDVGGHQTVARWFDHYNLEYRNNTEANRKLNAERDDHDEIVKAAHTAVREAVENGEWHLQTPGEGHYKYGSGWTDEKKEAVRERDGRRCQACGMKESEHIERCGCRLDVHHITPAARINNPKHRNAMENLVSMCRSCHRKWEGIPLRPQSVD